ncbi:MAG: PorT family protein [Saprospiraceae bacterium]|nr:PorT family protein [Saprospiraceae bacterium]MBP6235941.1 PorT family protein [Saprospiraceae bacterium]MBP6567178.1 PorT family protein [Saprospiraceae bacterium]
MLLLLTAPLMAQIGGKDNYNFRDFNRKSYYFGINIGFNSSGYKLQQSGFFINNDSIKVTEGKSEVGVNMHMVTNLKLGEYFDFRFLPGFSFAQRGLEFTSVSDSKVIERKIESVFFELPFHIRFKSEPYKDKRMFVVAGLKYSYDVQTNSKSRKSLIRIAPHDFQYEVGVGMQMFYPYFIFSPEIKFSRGLGNILIYDKSQNEARVLENVVSQIFTISFNFEG